MSTAEQRAGEQEFLRGYDPGEFPPFAVTVDLAVFTIRGGLLTVLLSSTRDELVLPTAFFLCTFFLTRGARRLTTTSRQTALPEGVAPCFGGRLYLGLAHGAALVGHRPDAARRVLKCADPLEVGARPVKAVRHLAHPAVFAVRNSLLFLGDARGRYGPFVHFADRCGAAQLLGRLQRWPHQVVVQGDLGSIHGVIVPDHALVFESCLRRMVKKIQAIFIPGCSVIPSMRTRPESAAGRRQMPPELGVYGQPVAGCRLKSA
jgi:hypothetical protein